MGDSQVENLMANAFAYPWWVYVTIPLGAAFVGWITKIMALKMMFYPVEFKGIPPTSAGRARFPSAHRKWLRWRWIR